MIDKIDETLPFAGGETEVGFKLQVIVAFPVEQVKVVAELKLLTEVKVTVEVVDDPTLIVPEIGLTPILKSGAAPTLKL